MEVRKGTKAFEEIMLNGLSNEEAAKIVGFEHASSMNYTPIAKKLRWVGLGGNKHKIKRWHRGDIESFAAQRKARTESTRGTRARLTPSDSFREASAKSADKHLCRIADKLDAIMRCQKAMQGDIANLHERLGKLALHQGMEREDMLGSHLTQEPEFEEQEFVTA